MNYKAFTLLKKPVAWLLIASLQFQGVAVMAQGVITNQIVIIDNPMGTQTISAPIEVIDEAGNKVILRDADARRAYMQNTVCADGRQATCNPGVQAFPRTIMTLDSGRTYTRRKVESEAQLKAITDRCAANTGRNTQGGCVAPGYKGGQLTVFDEKGEKITLSSPETWQNYLSDTPCMPGKEVQETCAGVMQFYPRTVMHLRTKDSKLERIRIANADMLNALMKDCPTLKQNPKARSVQGSCWSWNRYSDVSQAARFNQNSNAVPLIVRPHPIAGNTSRSSLFGFNPGQLPTTAATVTRTSGVISESTVPTQGFQAQWFTDVNYSQYDPKRLDAMGLPYELHDFSLDATAKFISASLLKDSNPNGAVQVFKNNDARLHKFVEGVDYKIVKAGNIDVLYIQKTEKTVAYLEVVLGQRGDEYKLTNATRQGAKRRGEISLFLADQILAIASVSKAQRTKPEQELLNYFTNYSYNKLAVTWNIAKKEFDEWALRDALFNDPDAREAWEEEQLQKNNGNIANALVDYKMGLRLRVAPPPPDPTYLISKAEGGLSMTRLQQVSFGNGANAGGALAAGLGAGAAVGIALPVMLNIGSLATIVAPFSAATPAALAAAEGLVAAGEAASLAEALPIAFGHTVADVSIIAGIVIGLAAAAGSFVLQVMSLSGQTFNFWESQAAQLNHYFLYTGGPAMDWMNFIASKNLNERNSAAQRVAVMTMRMATAY